MTGFASGRVSAELFPQEAHERVTLVIGDIARWKAEGRNVVALDGFHFVDLDALNQETLFRVQPDIILSPLVADNFDVVDVAARLIELKFKGNYRAISEPLPDSDIIRREVQSFAPDIDFDLLLMPLDDND